MAEKKPAKMGHMKAVAHGRKEQPCSCGATMIWVRYGSKMKFWCPQCLKAVWSGEYEAGKREE